ncbi:ATP-binding protein [Mesoterricola sediminis]|uniref:histidine kinase n=1 Tax=Mesoterricola sediminis TaxID=2927980 RepID=A0AA48GPZ4_9BACT|nr:ATP-binding protein [Mesoterricola sediminis]BDU75429.1 hypothetical protein METESE_03870 [Mesoterricola sediminis]
MLAEAAPAHESPEPPAHILVVDPDPHYCDLVARILTPKYGFEACFTARTLAEAEAHLRSGGISLIFVDLNLRESRGIDTLRAVQALAGDAQILVLTAVTDEVLGLQAMRQGAHDFLTKGHLGPDALRRTARYALERHKAGRALLRSQTLLSASLDAVRACIAILDADRRILMVNNRWRETGPSINPLVQGTGPGCDYFQHLQDLARPEDTAVVEEVLAGRQSSCCLDYPVEVPGGTAWYELRVEAFHEHGTSHFLVAHFEITARKLLEVDLKASQDLFTLITQNIIDLVSIVDASGRRLFLSPSYERQLGYPLEELHRLDTLALVHPEDRPRLETMLERLFLGDAVSGHSYRLLRRDGQYRTFEANGSPIPRPFGQPHRALLVARDVTDRLAAEEERQAMEVQLRQAQKLEAIGQLAAGIAHEINTPIQYVGDNTIFLRDTFKELSDFLEGLQGEVRQGRPLAPDDLGRRLEALDTEYLVDEIPRAIQQTLDGVGRVSRIVAAMKDFSHPGGSRERVDLNRAVESTITVSRNAWKYCATLEMDLDPTLPPVPCFPSELNQAVLNLVVNAAHAIEEKRAVQPQAEPGLIRVSTRNAGGQVEIRVSDNGTGIPEAIRTRIFDPFFTTKAVGKGTGQGLSIVRAVVVDKHGGAVDVASDPGRGTTFLLSLPLEVRS